MASSQLNLPINLLIKKNFEKYIAFENLGAGQFDSDKLYSIRFAYSLKSNIFYFLDPDFNKIKQVIESSGTSFKWNCVYETQEGEMVSQLAPIKISIRTNEKIFLAITLLSKLTKELKFTVMKEKMIDDLINLEKLEGTEVKVSKIEVFDESFGMTSCSMIEELKDGSVIIGVRSLNQFFELQRQWENNEPSYKMAGAYNLPCKTARMCKIECKFHGSEYLAFSLEDDRIALVQIKGRTEFGKLKLHVIQYIELIQGKLLFSPVSMAFSKNLNILLVCNLQKNPKNKQSNSILEAFQLKCGTFNNHTLQYSEAICDFNEILLPTIAIFDENDNSETLLLVASSDLKKFSIYTLYKSDRLFLIRGKDKGRKAWHYVLVESRENRKKLRAQIAGSNIDVTEYGSIVKSGWGEDPSKEIVEEMEEKYGN